MSTIDIDYRPPYPYVDEPTPRIDPEVKAKWVAALRSGKYKQGRSALRTVTYEGNKYCCLGVLCDIDPRIESYRHEYADGSSFSFRTAGEHDNNNTALPDTYARTLLGSPLHSDSEFNLVSINELGTTLAQLNDGRNADGKRVPGSFLTFDQIADIIDYFL